MGKRKSSKGPYAGYSIESLRDLALANWEDPPMLWLIVNEAYSRKGLEALQLAKWAQKRHRILRGSPGAGDQGSNRLPQQKGKAASDPRTAFKPSWPMPVRVLHRCRGPEDFALYRAGLEWNLSDPIVIENRQDIRSESLWQDRFEPYHHQVSNLITFCRRLPVTLLADDVGLGKTVSAGLIMSELISRSRLSKALVVCPKILGYQWKEELEGKFGIPAAFVVGKDLTSCDPAEGAVITTYASARSHLESIPKDRFQMLILDEAHKLRNLHGVGRAPEVAIRFRNALEDRRFRYVLMLTATPVQNRLWDLYSLVDLLTVARGHENPFGDADEFARNFIADNRNKARRLKNDARHDFQKTVYSYMSRVRRADAGLSFPERSIHTQSVSPTDAEHRLMNAIKRQIREFNRLSQVSLLQALTSSPEALSAQLEQMAKHGTAPIGLVTEVQDIVSGMSSGAKLDALRQLIGGAQEKNPRDWRIVVFTTRLETQEAIRKSLKNLGIEVGVVNGNSGARNQEAIRRFRQSPPACHVIVSTEAGSEGVNLQVANILVNYDMPWNPMIVEQRIGRLQRLGSTFEKVFIVNIMLKGTFEEYIVGRLMQKLQMAADAIGDIEGLLEASGVGDNDREETGSFEENIRKLVVASLQGKDVEAAARKMADSITRARKILRERKVEIDRLLGGMQGREYQGPQLPRLPGALRSMSAKIFTVAALGALGFRVSPQRQGFYRIEKDGNSELIRISDNPCASGGKNLFCPGSGPFLRLVDQIVGSGLHNVNEADQDPEKSVIAVADHWISSFGGTMKAAKIESVSLCFSGVAVLRVRATVAHDSYERLVEVCCVPAGKDCQAGRSSVHPLPERFQDPDDYGINLENVHAAAARDEAIAEFVRFYEARRDEEVKAARGDERKERKLEVDFTPRLDMVLVALEGECYRRFSVEVQYEFAPGFENTSKVTITPSSQLVEDLPDFGVCAVTGCEVPADCLRPCQVSGRPALPHAMAVSDLTGRRGLPEFQVICSLTGKCLLQDEAEESAVSGRLVASSELMTSAVSGKRAEPQYFGECDFTHADVLESELIISGVSNRRYRADQEECSAVSGVIGHESEFVRCHETLDPILPTEAEECAETGAKVRPGILRICGVTGIRALPSEFARCTVTGKSALRRLQVVSSVSGHRLLETAAVRSSIGNFCAPNEQERCRWSGSEFHPDDLRYCGLTGIRFHHSYVAGNDALFFRPLFELLNGWKTGTDAGHLWEAISEKAHEVLGSGRCSVEAAVMSPSMRLLAVRIRIRTRLGLKTRVGGLVYSIEDNGVVGRILKGRAGSSGWSPERDS